MWVRILAVSVVRVSLRKTFNCTLLFFSQEYVRVEVDIVFDKSL